MRAKAVYTVEASFVVSLSLIILGACIALGYDIFYDAAAYVVRKKEIFDAPTAFRMKELLNGIK
ncbi:MAG: hypothetical protein HUJ70_13605 [Pseudobutyrivibrio sp.]|nr:hypothetical protein [Pseudobutyrivibrio sp.]